LTEGENAGGHLQNVAQRPQQAHTVGGRRAFANIRRELTEEELGSLGVQRLITNEGDQTEAENVELKEFRRLYFECKQECAVLKEHARKTAAHRLLSSLCLTVAGAFLMINSVVAIVLIIAVALSEVVEMWPRKP